LNEVLDFGVFALHGLIKDLNVGEDGFPVRSIQQHHIVDVKKRVDAELLVRRLKGQFEVLSSGFGSEFVHGDFARAEVAYEGREGHSVRPGSREILNVDVTLDFVLNPKEECLFDEVCLGSKVFVLLSFVLFGSSPGFSLELDHSGSDVGLLHPGLLVDGLNGFHHLLQNVQPVTRANVDTVDDARHGDCWLLLVAVVVTVVVVAVVNNLRK